MLSNREISRLFSLYAELLLLHKKDERLAALLSGASYRLKNITESVTELSHKDLLKQFRQEIVTIIDEIKGSGSINAAEELIELTPQGLFEMMRIKGLGGRKLSVLWNDAGIDSLEALLEVCKQNKVAEISGFGVKTQENIITQIEAYHAHQHHFHYAIVAGTATALVKTLQQIFKTKLVRLCGEVRRQTLTVERIEIIAAILAKDVDTKAVRRILVINSSNKAETQAHTLDEIPVVIYHTTKTKFYYDLFLKTRNESHVKKVCDKLKQKSDFTSEEIIYKTGALPYVVPEMREDVAEWNFNKEINQLITVEDIKGVVHNHTTWSDGIDSLSDFVTACKGRKYEYVVISDHSKNAHYAGGLKEEKVLKQMNEIDKLNKKLQPFKILKSIECDILVSGELDYHEDLLKQFDLVIVSVHQQLKMNEEKATARLIKAIENPYTTILGHATGRQLLIRPGYPINFKKVIDACAANGVVIEVNANPYRLDIDWSHIPYALSKGVMISINPDAHSIGEIDNIQWGVSAARKGGLTKDMTWNAMALKEIENWLKKRQSKNSKRSKISSK